MTEIHWLSAENKKLQARIEQLEQSNYNGSSFNWLEANRYAKLKGQMTQKIQSLLATAYSKHGYGIYAAGITKEIMNMVEESWDIIRGEEKPLPDPDIKRWEI